MKKEFRSLLIFGAMLVAALFLRLADGEEEVLSPAPQNVMVAATPTSPAVAVPDRILWPEEVTTNALVTRVVDGDTIEALVDGEQTVSKIRFLGVNTPESVDPRQPVQCFGKEASAYAKDLLQNKRVFLAEDPQADDRDKYGRLLRAVVLEDGTDMSATLIQQGYAHAYLSFPLNARRKAQLRLLEEEAKTEERGLWNPQTCNGEAY